ncbi:MAG: response regulator [Leptolyngbya sp. UWPOB_LEPTO1]|uniref:hybrid sensor histidine kinase/response regulator n=1 Tax=Leptolyngbya sp. UWPOB_LEPTO1 TaxID=2815653 RepID=UPI001AC1C189|nr:response regulator [Leptolyngbya sp. UWPOB_LEPTO1]MBN8559933.1 response regulator [Leptolyngbya sp. UWPOB_LEPTO1]
MSDYSMLELFRQEVKVQVTRLKQNFMLFEHQSPSANEIQDALHALETVHGLAQIVEVEAAVMLSEAMQSRLKIIQPEKRLDSIECDRLIQSADWLLEMSLLEDSERHNWIANHQQAIVEIQASPTTDSLPLTPDSLPLTPDSQTRSNVSLALIDSQMMDLFRLEVEEQAKTLNQELLTLEANPTVTQPLEALMRAAHSIKGAARIVGIDAAVGLAHTMEDCFVAAQNRSLILTAELVDSLLSGVDLLQYLSQVSDQDLPNWIEHHQAAIAAVQSSIQTLRKSPTQVSDVALLPIASPQQSLNLNQLSPIQNGKDLNSSDSSTQDSAPSSQRVVRVSADNLTRMMGLAGESLIEANALPAFADSLRQVRSRQIELSTTLETLEPHVNAMSDKVTQALFETVRQQEQQCRNLLSDRLSELEDFIRRTTNLSERLYQEVITSHMRPFEEGMQNFPRMVRDLARSLNKRVKLEILGQTTSVDRDILARLEAPITHILRNAIDHGIESPETRVAAGKSAEGTIQIEAAHRGGMLAIAITDDGIGIDTQKLRQAIIARQLVAPEIAAKLSHSELMEFLFLPGFSLSEQVTELSGRGVGLDIVKRMAQEVGGTVRVTSQPGKGTGFYFQLPLTLSVVRTLLVDVAGEVYAFPLSRIDQIVTVEQSEIFTAENRQYFTFDQNNIGLIPLYQVLDLSRPTGTSERYWVVMLSDQSATYGLIVDRCLGEKELVVRPLDPRLGKVQDVSAAALMNDGSLVLILDVSDLIRSTNRLLQNTRLAKVSELRSLQHQQNAKRVLVVDDSITVRELERKLLQNHGYVVDIAVDGMEGWNAVRSYPYDLVISDIDMPRMNGIELIKAIKQHSRFHAIPVIVVSYRDREDDRIQGLEAGADYYLTKNSFHDDTLIRAVTDLIGE